MNIKNFEKLYNTSNFKYNNHFILPFVVVGIIFYLG